MCTYFIDLVPFSFQDIFWRRNHKHRIKGNFPILLMNYPLKSTTLSSSELKSLEHLSSQQLVTSTMGLFKEKMALSSSFQMEESVLIHMMAEAGLKIEVFALDTGCLNAETHNLAKDLSFDLLHFKISRRHLK